MLLMARSNLRRSNPNNPSQMVRVIYLPNK
nr:MAG TPA: hypothetical protein [Caudoviricetes sp.]